jgi:hypothetical protein
LFDKPKALNCTKPEEVASTQVVIEVEIVAFKTKLVTATAAEESSSLKLPNSIEDGDDLSWTGFLK